MPIPIQTIRHFTATFALVALPLQSVHSQAGDAKDKDGQVQTEVWQNMDVPPAPVLTPEQAMKTFSVEPGYKLELVAAEPLVNDPVAITWDEQGRLWVAEMWAYMPDVDGTGEDQPISRIVILQDDDQDGQMDRSTVFLDQLVLPRAVAIVKGGALIADPPNLYFCEDTDGDLVSDRKTIVATYAAKGNVEHSENGLMHGLDNWIYNAKSNRRFKFNNGRIQEEKTQFRGQWGITQDDQGRLYFNDNSFFLYGDMVPWENVTRHPGHKPQAGIYQGVVTDQSVFSNRINPGINRAYRENWLRPDNRIRKADAVSAPSIARGGRYPEDAQGNAFIPEPAGNIVSRFQLHENGFDVTAEKKLHESTDWGPVEFIASTDERFRPVATAMGPDGFTYVVDMYRGILQHKTYLTSFLRKQIIERGLDNPVGLGRIYRIVHESDEPSGKVPQLAGLSPIDLVPHLSSENGWIRDTSQRLLVESETTAPDTIQALRHAATHGKELGRIHALWTLQGLGQADAKTLVTAYARGTEWTRVHALRISAPLLAQAQRKHNALWKTYTTALKSPQERVQLQALQLLPDTQDSKLTTTSLAQLTPQQLNNSYFIDAAVSALHNLELEMLSTIAVAENPTKFSKLLTSLVLAAFKEGNADKTYALAKPLESDSTEASLKLAIASGLKLALAQTNVRPLQLHEAPDDPPEPVSQLFQAFSWPGKVDPNAIVDYAYTDQDLASINRGQALYTNTCSICHQPDGNGSASLAPPLAGSAWVTGPKERLALVVGHGLVGPIEVRGELWNQAMPPHGQHPALAGESFNDLLNYLRASWGNNASPFAAGEARAYLKKHSDRDEPWIVEEFEDLGLASGQN